MRATAFILLLTACGSPQPTPVESTPVRLTELDWLLEGPWVSTPDEHGCFSLETWRSIDEAHFAGESLELCSSDDSVARVSEELALEVRADGLYYVASPVGQARTEFRLTSGGTSGMVVENPQHDFPTRIAYRRIDGEHLEATVEGPSRSFTVSFTRRARPD